MVTSNDLQTMKSILIKSGKWDGHALDAYTARDNGKKFTDQEHLKGIIYALLTCNRPWYIVVPYLNEIDELFCHYDFNEIRKRSADYYLYWITDEKRKLGNRQIKAQMYALNDNLDTLERITKEFGSVDAFVTSDSIMNVADKLVKSDSPYKIKRLGPELVMEYLKNVGLNISKPDLHMKRFLGSGRMGTSSGSEATDNEVHAQVGALCQASGMSAVEIDAIIWQYCSIGYGEICNAKPDCKNCPFSKHSGNGHCNY